MSPILIRPVREQLEHDRVVRILETRWKKRFDVAANVGEDRLATLKVGQSTYYPDLVFTASQPPRRLQGVAEVETGESVNNLEAMAQWAHFAKVRAPFYLYVPEGAIDIAKRLCVDHQIQVSELWTYGALGEQMRFTLVQRADGKDVPAEPEILDREPDHSRHVASQPPPTPELPPSAVEPAPEPAAAKPAKAAKKATKAAPPPPVAVEAPPVKVPAKSAPKAPPVAAKPAPAPVAPGKAASRPVRAAKPAPAAVAKKPAKTVPVRQAKRAAVPKRPAKPVAAAKRRPTARPTSKANGKRPASAARASAARASSSRAVKAKPKGSRGQKRR